MKRGLARLVWWSTRESPKVIDRPLARVEAATLGGALRALAEHFALGLAYARLAREVERNKAISERLRLEIARLRRGNGRLRAQTAAVEQRNRKTKARIAAMDFEAATFAGKRVGSA